MGSGAAIAGAVVVVRDLRRSEAFYRELLELDVEASSGEAVLLSSRGGDRLVLRRLSAAPHVTGGIGVLFVIWSAPTAADLDHAEEVMRTREAFASRSVDDGWDVLEGYDPDNTRVVVAFPLAPNLRRTSLPSRVFNY
jgi:catechol 2,3-dioxygenase-like lactoylglutathione lyase family enzyme